MSENVEVLCTSESKCTRAMDSDNLIKASNSLTIIMYATRLLGAASPRRKDTYASTRRRTLK